MAEQKSKLAAFLADKKIDARRVLATSKRLENLTVADRAVRLKKAQARKAEGGEKPQFEKGRSGRPVSPRALQSALEGAAVTGPVKTRIVRAVNHLLEQKKGEPVELRTLF